MVSMSCMGVTLGFQLCIVRLRQIAALEVPWLKQAYRTMLIL